MLSDIVFLLLGLGAFAVLFGLLVILDDAVLDRRR